MTTILKPKSLSTYEMHAHLGEGLSSRVVAATKRDADGFSEQSVVLKILKSETAVSWLQKEFEALRSVQSVNCVRVLGWESFAEGPALVLEQIKGPTLYEMGRRFLLNECEIDEIAVQVERGLGDLHRSAIFHGDLSPKNILIDEDGVIKLIDFGSTTGQSELIGTAAYLSHARWSKNPATAACDFASWTLIAHDLRQKFANVPHDLDQARLRAAEFDSRPETAVRSESGLRERESLKNKVRLLLAEQKSGPTTQVVQHAHSKWSSLTRVSAALVFLILSTPVFSSAEPLLVQRGAVRVLTMKWTSVTVDGGPSRYAPAVFKALSAGHHRLEWRRQGASGALEVEILPNRIQTLVDANFRR
jgi:serine/threonine protein kinase